MAVKFCTCRQLRGTGWKVVGNGTVHNKCMLPSQASAYAKVKGEFIQYHVFIGGPLPENQAYALRSILTVGGTVDVTGYEPTEELRESKTNPGVFARVWEYTGG